MWVAPVHYVRVGIFVMVAPTFANETAQRLATLLVLADVLATLVAIKHDYSRVAYVLISAVSVALTLAIAVVTDADGLESVCVLSVLHLLWLMLVAYAGKDTYEGVSSVLTLVIARSVAMLVGACIGATPLVATKDPVMMGSAVLLGLCSVMYPCGQLVLHMDTQTFQSDKKRYTCLLLTGYILMAIIVCRSPSVHLLGKLVVSCLTVTIVCAYAHKWSRMTAVAA